MQRRSFLAGILAAASAPAIVHAGSLMKIHVPKIWTPKLLGVDFGTNDDFTIEAWIQDARITDPTLTLGTDGGLMVPRKYSDWTLVALNASGFFVQGVLQRDGPEDYIQTLAAKQLSTTAKAYFEGTRE